MPFFQFSGLGNETFISSSALAECRLQRLLDNTAAAHPDYDQLHQAEKTIHQLALRINSVKESKHEEDLQETLRKLELLLITDVLTLI